MKYEDLADLIVAVVEIDENLNLDMDSSIDDLISKLEHNANRCVGIMK